MQAQKDKEIIYLSSSRIDTLKTCTWLYYSSYVLKLPDKQNDGSRRGSAAHDLLECLCHPQHAHILEKLQYVEAPDEIPQIKRFLQRKFKQLDLKPDEEVKKVKGEKGNMNNWRLVQIMLMNALRHEFFDNIQNGKKVIHSEYSFSHVNESPRYAVRGFIDRLAEVEDGKVLEILDYKSSKAKFDKEKKTQNLQGMIYSLMARKLWSKYDRYVANFFFMRFPSDPYQKHEFTEEELSGLELYLEYITNFLENFDEKAAISDLASNNKERSWMCGRGSWQCPYKKEFFFFIVQDAQGVQKSSHLTHDEALKALSRIKNNEGHSVELRHYQGCPSWKPVDSGDNLF